LEKGADVIVTWDQAGKSEGQQAVEYELFY
jgi:hypothetical protein